MVCLAGYDLCKSYLDSNQTINVLRKATIEVKEAELVCITGQSGSGKSTLLHLLGLLDSPDSGKVMISGHEINSTMPEAASIRNLELGFVFQFHYLIEDLNAQENVALPMIISGVNSSQAIKKAAELLQALDLEDRINHYPNQLSGGEQQRVALARALINNPKIVLADEPTGNLDPEHSAEVWDMIIKLNKERGQTFVIVTHDIVNASKAKVIYNLSEGKLEKK
ncbi:MAG TPA: ABC transporter ATP-binding protein [Candidatus Cloacimonas sp.]|nr:ABC transporter ATP-binding protein [Candidatus Cloacimonas sp.]